MGEENVAAKIDDLGTPRAGKSKFYRRQAPYLVVLALALAGVAYSNVSHAALSGYWEFLAALTAVLCIYSCWDNPHERKARFQLVWTQALHWVAVLVSMNIMLLGGVQLMLPPGAASLVLLILLALGTFLAGVSLFSIPLAFLGMVLAAAVPAISWLQQSILFFVVGGVFLVGLVLAFVPRGSKA